MADSDGDDAPATEEELEALREEVERLRAENEKLAQEEGDDAGEPSNGRSKGKVRALTALSLVLIVLGSALVPVSVLAVWLDRTITDTDRYVETVAPLARDEAVQAAVTRRLAEAFDKNVDLDTEVAQLLPDRAQPLAAPIAAGIQQLVRQVIARVLASDQFAELWDRANRAAQRQVVAVLTDAADRRGVVEVDLSDVGDEVSKRLTDMGVPFADRLEGRDLTLEVMQSDQVAEVQDAFKWWERLAGVLPWVTLVVLAAGVLVAPDRRRALRWAATGWVIACALLAVALALGRELYLESLPTDASMAANEAFFDTIVRFLRGALRTVFAVGLAVLVAVLVTGPSRPAVALRRGLSRAFGAAGSEAGARGVDLGPVGAFVARNIAALRVAIGVVAALWFLVLDRPSAGNVMWIAVVALVVLAVVELVARIAAATPVGAALTESGSTPGGLPGRPPQPDPS